MKVMWEGKIVPSEWKNPAYPPITLGLQNAALLFEDMNEPFDRNSDQINQGRDKLIHSGGSVAKVKLVPAANQPFTGLFKGSDNGIVRLSLAAPPSAAGVTPGMGLKFFRDGADSGNIIAMWALDGQGDDYNFFKNEFRNYIDDPSGLPLKILAKVFEKGALEPAHITADGMAEDHTSQEAPVAPKEVFFVPKLSFDSAEHEFRADLATIATGTTIYEMWGTTSECRCNGGPCQSVKQCASAVKIGDLVTSSRFVASEYSDKYLFFQHYRYHQKPTTKCTYAEDFTDRAPARYAGDHRSECVASDSCPGAAIKSASGCPYLSLQKAKIAGAAVNE